jgi:hypothetical protein
VLPEGLGKLEKIPPYRDAIPRPSGLWHSASTTTLPRAVGRTGLGKQMRDVLYAQLKADNYQWNLASKVTDYACGGGGQSFHATTVVSSSVFSVCSGFCIFIDDLCVFSDAVRIII